MNLICIILAIVLFLLSAFGVVVGHVALAPLGAAFLAASFLPWKV